MPLRLVALDDGPDILVDRAVVVVGRHPQCDSRLDSIRVSRRHCCMSPDQGELVVRDLGSTNGIRINGQRVEMGRLRPGDELSIAHIRYRLDSSQEIEPTLADHSSREDEEPNGHHLPSHAAAPYVTPNPAADKNNPLAEAVRDLLPPGLADRCRIQVIVQMQPEAQESEVAEPCRPDSCP